VRYAALFEASVYHTLTPQGHAHFVARKAVSNRGKSSFSGVFAGGGAVEAAHKGQDLAALVFGSF
jgi:hypothetical protein